MSWSMDFGCLTLDYVFRSWGGSVATEEISVVLSELRDYGCTEYENPNLLL